MKPVIDDHIITTVKSVMLQHIGHANAIPYDDLTAFIFGKATDNNRRKLRAYISHINADETNKVVICSDRADSGLFMNGWSETDQEKHAKFIAEEESQALSTLSKLSAMKHKLNQMYGSELLKPVQQAQGRFF